MSLALGAGAEAWLSWAFRWGGVAVMRKFWRKPVENPSLKKKLLPEVSDIRGWRQMQVLPMGILASPQQGAAVLGPVSEPAGCDDTWMHDGDSLKKVGHKPPYYDHCGWYAMYDREAILELRPNSLYGSREEKAMCHVLVSAIGETILCRKGFQSYQIRIEEIHGYMSEALAAKLAERYQCPVYRPEEEPCESESPSDESSPFPVPQANPLPLQTLADLLASPRTLQPGAPLANQSGFARQVMSAAGVPLSSLSPQFSEAEIIKSLLAAGTSPDTISLYIANRRRLFNG